MRKFTMKRRLSKRLRRTRTRTRSRSRKMRKGGFCPACQAGGYVPCRCDKKKGGKKPFYNMSGGSCGACALAKPLI